MIFANVFTDDIIRQGDKLRLDATKSFGSGVHDDDDIDIVEIDPGDGTGFVVVKASGVTKRQSEWFLDWVYLNTPTGGQETMTIQVRVTSTVATGAEVSTQTRTLELIDKATDNLWSDDNDLITHEPNIRKYLKSYRFNFNDFHRGAQELILKWLDQMKYTLSDGHTPVGKDNILNDTDMREWSAFQALELIYQAQSNVVDDIHSKKAEHYFDHKSRARSKKLRGVDWNQSGEIENFEHENLDITEVIQVTKR